MFEGVHKSGSRGACCRIVGTGGALRERTVSPDFERRRNASEERFSFLTSFDTGFSDVGMSGMGGVFSLVDGVDFPGVVGRFWRACILERVKKGMMAL